MPGETVAKGYGREHVREREHWTRVIREQRGVRCHARTCVMPSRWIRWDDEVKEPWDLGHTEDRTAWTGPEHRRCNRRAGAVNSNRTGNPGSSNPRRRTRRRTGLVEVSVDPSEL
ncbi:MAG TPA: hypothetical protein VGP26_24655 [Actinophytocola sp.]|jgi:hypothetical protein|nr:hypothetical protein [Actinophytocola sp.]